MIKSEVIFLMDYLQTSLYLYLIPYPISLLTAHTLKKKWIIITVAYLAVKLKIVCQSTTKLQIVVTYCIRLGLACDTASCQAVPVAYIQHRTIP